MRRAIVHEQPSYLTLIAHLIIKYCHPRNKGLEIHPWTFVVLVNNFIVMERVIGLPKASWSHSIPNYHHFELVCPCRVAAQNSSDCSSLMNLFPNACTLLVNIPIARLQFTIGRKFTIALFTITCSLLYHWHVTVWYHTWYHRYKVKLWIGILQRHNSCHAPQCRMDEEG